MTEWVCGSQGGHGDDVRVPVCNRGKRAGVCLGAEPLRAVHISPGIYICSILFLCRLISHVARVCSSLSQLPSIVFLPNRSLANFLFISHLSFLLFFFFFSVCAFVFSPPSSPCCLEAVQQPLPATEQLLNFLHMYNQTRHSGALIPICGVNLL